MTKTIIRMRFDNEAQAIETLPMLRDEDGWVRDGDSYTLVLVGRIMESEGVPGEDPDGPPLVPPTYKPGWHADILVTDACPDKTTILEAVAPYVVEPAGPRHKFAGEQ